MIRFFCILIFILAALSASAQQYSTKNTSVDIPGLSKVDTLSAKAKKKINRINKKIAKLQGKKTSVPNVKETESAKSTAQRMLNAPNEVERNITGQPAALKKKMSKKLAKLNAEQEVDQYNQKVNVMQKHFKHHLDSLAKLPTKDPHVTKTMDSLKKKMKHLKEAKSIKGAQKGEEQLAKLQPGLNSKVKGLESKVNKELSALNLGNVKAPNLNVPNLNVPKVNLPGVNTSIPGLNASLPNVNIPSLGNSSLPNTNLSMPGTPQPNMPAMPSTSTNLPGNIIPSTDLKELSNIQKEAGQITKATGDITKAEGELKNLNTDNVEKTLEKDAMNLKEVKQLGGEAAQLEQYKKMVAKWESDPEYKKELAVTKAKEQAVNHFAGQEKQLMAAMQQLTNVKTKYKDYEGTLDMFKKPGNAMKGKPFIERLRPGFNLQIQSKHEVMLDFNPQFGYRITGAITAGIGWNERWGYDFSKWNYISLDHVYGPRGYAQMKIKPGAYAMISPEVMNALVPPYFNSLDPATRKWVWTWMGGVKKEFRYSKKMLGSMQVLYNLFDKHNQSPYVSKLNIRMGFEFPLKKEIH